MSTSYQHRSVQDLRTSVHAGMLHGLSLVGPGSQLELSRAAEQSARRNQALREAARDRRAARRATDPAASRTDSVSRWASWLPFVPRPRSSDATQNSNASVPC